MAKLSTDELLDAFKEMTLIELSEFVKQFEEVFEVSAAAPVAMVQGGGGGGAGPGRGDADRHRGGGLDVEDLFELLHELGELDQRHLLERVEEGIGAELRHGGGFLSYGR